LPKLFNRKRPQIEPIVPSRVYRFYRGGALLGRLRGLEEPDGELPEEWVGSVTPASNPGRDEPEAGLSRLADGRLLRDAIAADPEGWLGRPHLERYGVSTGLLVKLLDAAERLPVHAHPDRAFAAERLGSPFGKTEAWIVLATRGETAEVRVGLSRPVDRARYREWIERQDVAALLGSLHRVDVRAGDVVYVPAGVPHAIGAGVLIAELQEPTDLSLICEWSGFPIDPEAAHLGLGWDVAVEALDLDARPPALGLPPGARAFFWADETPEPAGRFAVLLVLSGDGAVEGRPARPGDAFAVPAATESLTVEGDLRILRCLAPEPG
jgi:mannose-6-phosphate isomerase